MTLSGLALLGNHRDCTARNSLAVQPRFDRSLVQSRLDTKVGKWHASTHILKLVALLYVHLNTTLPHTSGISTKGRESPKKFVNALETP